MTEPPDIRLIAVDGIDVTDWPEPDFDFVTNLAERIRATGLLNPICVMRIPDSDHYLLVAGRHRLDACSRLEWEAIPASVLAYDKVAAELARISENLDRRDLSWLERAESVYRWNELLTTRGERPTRGRPWKNKPATVAGLWTTAAMAAKLGVSDRTVRRQVSLIGKLSQAVRDAARELPELVDSPHELEALANLPDDTARANALRFMRTHPSQPGDHRGVEYAHTRMVTRYAHCPTCDQAIDTSGWPFHYGDWRLWHCSVCDQHANQTSDPNQVCGNCGARREPTPDSATNQRAASPDPDPTPPSIGGADPTQSFAQQATQTSQALHDEPAPLPPSPHQQAKRALDSVTIAAEGLLRLQADVLGKQIADDHDPAYLEHARRTMRQVQEWITAFDDELF